MWNLKLQKRTIFASMLCYQRIFYSYLDTRSKFHQKPRIRQINVIDFNEKSFSYYRFIALTRKKYSKEAEIVVQELLLSGKMTLSSLILKVAYVLSQGNLSDHFQYLIQKLSIVTTSAFRSFRKFGTII